LFIAVYLFNYLFDTCCAQNRLRKQKHELDGKVSLFSWKISHLEIMAALVEVKNIKLCVLCAEMNLKSILKQQPNV